jgi:hypothetical protein
MLAATVFLFLYMFIRAPENDTHKPIGRLPGFEEDRPAPERTVAACLDACEPPYKNKP